MAPVQVSAVLAKSLEFVPLMVTVNMKRLPLPVLVRVTLCATLLVLRFWGGKVRPEEEKVGAGESNLTTKLEALTVPIPVVKSHAGAALNAG